MITISDTAAARINALTASGEHVGALLRLAVNPGGCSGFEYAFSFADVAADDDTVVTHNGARVVVDAASLPLVAGAVLDYESSLVGAHFAVKNPNATSGCGCGNSFGV